MPATGVYPFGCSPEVPSAVKYLCQPGSPGGGYGRHSACTRCHLVAVDSDPLLGCDVAWPGRKRRSCGRGGAQAHSPPGRVCAIGDRAFWFWRRCHYSQTGTDGPPDWCTYKVGGSAPTAAPPSATVPASTSTSACDGVCGGGGGESASITARRLRHMTRPCTWNRRCHARLCTLTKVRFRRL